jgi:hypothetical protein
MLVSAAIQIEIIHSVAVVNIMSGVIFLGLIMVSHQAGLAMVLRVLDGQMFDSTPTKTNGVATVTLHGFTMAMEVAPERMVLFYFSSVLVAIPTLSAL